MKRKAKISKRSPKRLVQLAIVVSRFNEEICENLLRGAVQVLEQAGLAKSQFDIFRVPGAFEIPLVAQKCAGQKKYAAVLCLGAVIRGETPHFEYICQATSQGIQQVALKTGKPILFGVLTTNTEAEAKARSEPDEYNKGREAALAALEMIEVLSRV